MERVLVSWIGTSDLKARDPVTDPGPVLRFLTDDQGRGFQTIYLLNDVVPPDEIGERMRRSAAAHVEWIAEHGGYDLDKFQRIDSNENLRNDVGAIWAFTVDQLERLKGYHSDTAFTFLVSPGYPSAQACLMVASETLFSPGEVELFNTSAEAGVEEVFVPFGLTGGRVLHRVAEKARVAREPHGFDAIIGHSAAIREAKGLARRLAMYSNEFAILILGDRGTGKELFAQALHRSSDRAKRRLVSLNCAAIAPTIAESELFGSVKGAATDITTRPGAVKSADRGTLFLDEIGLMPLEMQAKLLRFLQDGSYSPVGVDEERRADVWVIAATNRDLSKASEEGWFLPDLYDRLSEMELRIPPLSRRLEDVPDIAQIFLQRANADLRGRNPAYVEKSFSDAALRRLQQHVWPGNVRELRKTVRFLAFDVSEGVIDTHHVDRALGSPSVAYGYGLPLEKMDPGAFLIHLTAVVDELLVRYRDNVLPVPRCEGDYDLQEDIMRPLLYGRALDMCDTKTAAGRLLREKPATERADRAERTSSVADLTKGQYAAALGEYKRSFTETELIDERQVRIVRRGNE